MLERLCLSIAVAAYHLKKKKKEKEAVAANLQLILAVSFTFSVTVLEKVINYTLHTTLDTVCGMLVLSQDNFVRNTKIQVFSCWSSC